MTETEFTYGGYIKELRKRRGMKQKELARLIGMTAPYMSNVENGVRVFTAKNNEKLVKALNLTDSETEQLNKCRMNALNNNARRYWDGELHTESLGEYLRSLRLRRHMTEAELAKKLGVSYLCISTMELGRGIRKKDTIFAGLSSVLNLSQEETDLLYKLAAEYSGVNHPVWDGKLHTENFAEFLHSARLRAGLSLQTVGKAMNVTKQAVGSAESGRFAGFAKKNPDRLAEVLKLSEEETKVMKELLGADYIGKIRVFRKEKNNEEHENTVV